MTSIPRRLFAQLGSRTLSVATTPDAAFAPVLRIGGNTGWYAWNWPWRLRGFLDLLTGKPRFLIPWGCGG